MPDVELRRRRDIAGLGIGAAHQRQALDEPGQGGFAQQRERDIGERSGGDERELAFQRMGVGDDRFDGVPRVVLARRIGQDGVAEAARAVHVSRVARIAQDRRGAARPNGNVGAPGQRQHGARVAGRLGQIDVASDGRDADEARAGQAQA